MRRNIFGVGRNVFVPDYLVPGFVPTPSGTCHGIRHAPYLNALRGCINPACSGLSCALI